MVDQPELILRDKNNLDDYLYEPNTINQNKESEKVSFHIAILNSRCLTI